MAPFIHQAARGATTPEQPQGFAYPRSAIEQQEAAGLKEAVGKETVGIIEATGLGGTGAISTHILRLGA